MENPIEQGEGLPEGTVRYAVVADNDVVGILTFIKSEMDAVDYDRSIAGLESNPKIVSCDETVNIGWIWNGESFTSPVG
jgi:hypothetical protein